MTPLWRAGGAGKSQRLAIGTEVSEQLLGGTRRKTNLIETYGYQYDGFKPKSWQTYKMDWSADRIVWSIGGTERVAYTKQTFLTSGPLPCVVPRCASFGDSSPCLTRRALLQNPTRSLAHIRLLVRSASIGPDAIDHARASPDHRRMRRRVKLCNV